MGVMDRYRANPFQTADLAETYRNDLGHDTTNNCHLDENNPSRSSRTSRIDSPVWIHCESTWIWFQYLTVALSAQWNTSAAIRSKTAFAWRASCFVGISISGLPLKALRLFRREQSFNSTSGSADFSWASPILCFYSQYQSLLQTLFSYFPLSLDVAAIHGQAAFICSRPFSVTLPTDTSPLKWSSLA
jgi:hypothetical protein